MNKLQTVDFSMKKKRFELGFKYDGVHTSHILGRGANSSGV